MSTTNIFNDLLKKLEQLFEKNPCDKIVVRNKKDRRHDHRREADQFKRASHEQERYVMCATSKSGDCNAKYALSNRVIVHGLRGYGGLYLGYAQYLSDRGHNVVIIDFPGHGRTKDEPCRIRHMHAFENCVQSAIVVAYKLNPKVPTIVTAFSMGGLINLQYLNKGPRRITKHISAIISIGVPLSVGKDVTPWKVSLAPLIATFMPWWKIKETTMDEKNINHDPQVVHDISEDPIIYKGPLSAWTAYAILQMAKNVKKILASKRIQVPLLFLRGEFDETVDMSDYEELEIPLVNFPEMKHEILIGLGSHIVYEYIETWVEKIVIPLWKKK